MAETKPVRGTRPWAWIALGIIGTLSLIALCWSRREPTGIQPFQVRHKTLSARTERTGGTWYEVRNWQGQSDKRTDDFHVSAARGRIVWRVTGGEYTGFSVMLYSSSDEFVQAFGGAIGPDTDTGYFSGPGDFYLTIGCANGRYSVAVQDRRRPKSVSVRGGH